MDVTSDVISHQSVGTIFNSPEDTLGIKVQPNFIPQTIRKDFSLAKIEAIDLGVVEIDPSDPGPVRIKVNVAP